MYIPVNLSGCVGDTGQTDPFQRSFFLEIIDNKEENNSKLTFKILYN